MDFWQNACFTSETIRAWEIFELTPEEKAVAFSSLCFEDRDGHPFFVAYYECKTMNEYYVRRSLTEKIWKAGSNKAPINI